MNFEQAKEKAIKRCINENRRVPLRPRNFPTKPKRSNRETVALAGQWGKLPYRGRFSAAFLLSVAGEIIAGSKGPRLPSDKCVQVPDL